MASGSWNFATSNPYIQGRVEWWATPQGAVNNYSNVRLRLMLRRTNSGYVSYGTLWCTLKADYSKNYSGQVSISEGFTAVVDDSSFRVYHNSDGSKSLTIRAVGETDFGCNFDSTRTFNLDKIARYTSISSWNVASVTNNSIKFNWKTANAISKITCSFNGSQKYSSSVNASSGSFTVSGLSEHTTYSNIKITVTRKDSGLTTTSSAISATTSWTSHTSNISLHSRDINAISVNWSSNYACDYVRIYNGGTQIFAAGGLNSKGGTITLNPSNWSSIAPGGTYSLKAEVRRKDSQWWKTSGVISVTTLPCPIVDGSTPTSFNIGNNLAVTVRNQANAAYSLIFQTYNGSWSNYKTVNVSKGVANTTLTFTASDLYAKCPNSNTLATRIACQTTVNSKTYTFYYNVTARVVNSNPTFSNFSWITNVGTNINSVISGTQNMITGYGGLRLTFAANCASALNSASVKSLETKIIFGGVAITTGTIPYSASAFNFDVSTTNITTAGNYTIQINALDSRGNRSGVISHSFAVYAYKRPSVSASMYRFNNFEQSTLLKLTGRLAKITVSSVQKNSITSLKYRYTESGKAYPSTYTNITGYVSTAIGGTDDLSIAFNRIDENSPFATLDYAKSYIFQFLLTDKLLDSTVVEVFVAQGIPLMAVSEEGYVGVGKIPDFDSAAKLQVDSDIMANGRMILSEIDKKLDVAKIANNQTTTTAGYALDARQGKALADKYDQLNSNVNGNSTYINNYLSFNLLVKSGIKYIRCSGYPSQNMAANTNYSIGTLPVDYRPSYNIYQDVNIGSDIYVRIYLRTNGGFELRPLQNMTTNTGVNVNLTYM